MIFLCPSVVLLLTFGIIYLIAVRFSLSNKHSNEINSKILKGLFLFFLELIFSAVENVIVLELDKLNWCQKTNMWYFNFLILLANVFLQLSWEVDKAYSALQKTSAPRIEPGHCVFFIFFFFGMESCSRFLKNQKFQKQPPEVLCKKVVLKNILRKTPVWESLFNKVAGLKIYILKNISERLLL